MLDANEIGIGSIRKNYSEGWNNTHFSQLDKK